MAGQAVDEKIKYSKYLSSLLSSGAVVVLSFLCILNNPSLDLYSVLTLLKTVIPASICLWILGYVAGHILDSKEHSATVAKNFKLSEDNAAYTMPSMFASDSTDTLNDEIGEIEL